MINALKQKLQNKGISALKLKITSVKESKLNLN